MPNSHCAAPELASLLDGSRAGELIPELATRGLQQLIELEVAAFLGADRHERTEERLARLSQLEVGLDIDDFGTGFSSLACLYRYPTSAVKIDRSFIAGVGRPDNGSVLVQTMVALARNLGMDVIAEGVETEAQREALPFIPGARPRKPSPLRGAGESSTCFWPPKATISLSSWLTPLRGATSAKSISSNSSGK